MIQLSLYIAGRRRLCLPVPPSILVGALHAISERMPQLEAQGRVVVTGTDDGVVYIIKMQQESAR